MEQRAISPAVHGPDCPAIKPCPGPPGGFLAAIGYGRSVLVPSRDAGQERCRQRELREMVADGTIERSFEIGAVVASATKLLISNSVLIRVSKIPIVIVFA